MPSAPETVDVIVVLGGPHRALRRRTAQGIRLFEAGRAETLLLSGRGREDWVEADVMGEQARAAGVPDAHIVLEDESRTTLENAVFSARIMDARGWRSALVVTDALHLPRALLAFRGAGIRAKGSAVTRGWREEPVRTWVGHAAYEAAALVWYALRILARRHRR